MNEIELFELGKYQASARNLRVCWAYICFLLFVDVRVSRRGDLSTYPKTGLKHSTAPNETNFVPRVKVPKTLVGK